METSDLSIIIRDLDELLFRLRGIYLTDHEISRIHDTTISVKKRFDTNEMAIAEIEPFAIEKIHKKETLLQTKNKINTLIGAKMFISPLRRAVTWLNQEYPQTINMSLVQVLEFIDTERSSLRDIRDKMQAEIKSMSVDEEKYNNMIKRRENLAARLREKELEYEDAVSHSVALRKTLDDVAVLRQTLAKFNTSGQS